MPDQQAEGVSARTGPARGAHVPALAGLRAPAILAVMALHSQLHGVAGAVSGVEMFFVLSGFLITGLLITEHARTGRIDYYRFLARRALRILPALVVVIATSGLALALAFPTALVGIEAQVGHALTFTMDYYQGSRPASGLALGHLWSLAVEEKFYLVWPPLLAAFIWLTRRRPSALPLLIAQVAMLGYAEPALRYRTTTTHYPSVYFEADARTGGLLLGCAAAILLHQQPALRTQFARWWVGVLALAGLVTLIVDPEIVGAGQRPEVLLGLPVAGLASIVLIVHLASTRTGIVAGLLGFRPVAWVGDLSYSLYLWHLPVLSILIGRYGLSPWPALAAGFALSLALASITRVVVEAPAAAYSARLQVAWESGRAQRRRVGTVWSARVSIAAALSSAIAVGVASRARVVDDGDIVLRYVNNLFDGRGWVWNSGSIRNACTSFLHPLLIVVLEAGGFHPSTAATVVGTFGLALGACSAVVLLRRLGLPFAAIVAGVALPLLPLWTETWGLETSLFVGLLLAYAAAATGGRANAGLVAAISLTRPDGILILGPALLRARHQGRTIRFTLAAAAPVTVLAVVALARTGSPLPASVAAKKAQGNLDAFASFHYLPFLLTQIDSYTQSRTGTWILLALGATALLGIIRAKLWPILDLAGVTIAQTLLYAALKVPGYYWYYVPFLVVLGLVLLAGAELGVRALVRSQRDSRSSNNTPLLSRQVITAALALGATAAVVLSISTWAPGDNLDLQPREASYFAVAAWMRSQGPVQSVGVSEVGVLGVALPDARVTDIIGLTTTPAASFGPGAAHLLADPPQWLLVHLTVGGEGGIDLAAGKELRQSADEAKVALTDSGFGPVSDRASVWSVEGGVLRSRGFDHTYRMVRIFSYPGAGPLGVFEVRPGLPELPGLTAQP